MQKSNVTKQANKHKKERQSLLPFRQSSKPKRSMLPVTASKPSIEDEIGPGGRGNLQGTLALHQILMHFALNRDTFHSKHKIYHESRFCPPNQPYKLINKVM